MLHFWNSWIAFGNWTRILKPEDQQNVWISKCIRKSPHSLCFRQCQHSFWDLDSILSQILLKVCFLEIENLWHYFANWQNKYNGYFMRLCTFCEPGRGAKYISVNRKTQFNFVLKWNKMSQSILSWESWFISFQPKCPGQRNIGGDNVGAVRRKILVLD